ncbi:MAG: hypothetical protein PHD36_07085 [Desulfotomaculaceae bacterium]|nr:hypothetical protein [Desulfotomaculaceae bacterium]
MDVKEKDLLKLAATMFAGIVRSNDMAIELRTNEAGETDLWFKTRFNAADNEGVDVATIMTSLVKGLRNIQIERLESTEK